MVESMKNNNSENISLIPAVAYARFSSAGQNEASIEQQLRDIYKWADDHGYSVIGEYKDFARSAYKEATEQQRPEFRRMIDDSKKHEFQAVIVWKMDRFARSRYDSAIFKRELKKNNVKVCSAMEQIGDGPEGIILEGLMDSFAEYYSANLSQNVKRGLTDNARKFKVIGKTPLGYMKDPETSRYKIEPSEAEIVKKIFADYVAGASAVSIFTELNKAGIKTKEGHNFDKNSIRKILKNERYTGVYIFKEEKTPGQIPAIV